MKRSFLFLSLIFSVSVYAQTDVVPKKPSLAEGLVLDQTKTLTSEQLHTLREKLLAYDRSTSNQIAIVIIPALKGNSIEDVALEIGRGWGVGQANNDNGVVILIAKDDRKMRIEVGTGLEGAVTDYVTSSIIQNTLRPNFREDNYYRGLTEAVDEIIKAAEGRYTAPEGYGKKVGIKKWHIILGIIVIWIILGAIGRGGKGGGVVSRRGYNTWGGPIWWGGGGHSSGGGGWSGGGGGGFGGFGGGSFGGGGSSGSW
ncbi:MAG TPA: TPM domain-containing protein [Chitinophagaceae bacterium]